MKKSLLGLLLGGMLCVSVSANAAEDNQPKGSAVPLAAPMSTMDYETEPLAKAIINYEPAALKSDFELLRDYLDWNKLINQGKLVEAKIKEDFLNKVDPTGEKRAIFQGYVTKVLPIYAMARAARLTPQMAPDAANFKVDTVWAAPVDEIYYGKGDPRNHYDAKTAYGLSPEQIADGLAAGGRVKHNQSYLWGMVTVGKKVYWCTNTNYLCVGGPDGGLGKNGASGDITMGYENDCWVCEHNSGQYGKEVHALVKPEYQQYSDTRIPRIYCYDTETNTVEDITPYDKGEEYKAALDDCQGLRSAGSLDGVVFFGGPSLYGSSAGTTVGTQFFALDAETGKFIGCKNLKDLDGNTITDIRRWYVHEGILYCGVRLTDKNGVDCGAVLRWYGDKKDPWQFKIVGWMDSEAAELCVFNGRMYVGGWNTNIIKTCTMIMGPEMPAGGLQPAEDSYAEAKAAGTLWEIIWRHTSYDKNQLTNNTTYTAGILPWKGKLYFGTFAAAYTIPAIAGRFYTAEQQSSPEFLAFYLGSLRQTSFWSIDENNKVELLFGDPYVPYWKKFDKIEVVKHPVTGQPILDANGNIQTRPVGPDEWGWFVNGYTPKFGRAGYGQLFTAYSWTLEEYNGNLYVGTMNMENLIGGIAGTEGEGTNQMAGILKTAMGIDENNYGFELVRFTDPNIYPEYITTNGFGNGTAYGIRNFTKCGDDLYVGSASPLNLKEFGGCHLFKVTEQKDAAPEVLPTDVKEAKTPGIVFKRLDNSLIIASLNGENITNITMCDAAGRVLFQGNGTNVVTIPTAGVTGVVIVKTTTASGEWTNEILVK